MNSIHSSWVEPPDYQSIQRRPFAKLHLAGADVATNFLLAGIFTAAWWYSVPSICQLWRQLFRFCIIGMGLKAEVQTAAPQSSMLYTAIPFLKMSAGPIQHSTLWITWAVTLLVLATSLLLPKNHTPLIYLLRGMVIIQGSALVYFFLRGDHFPHNLSEYMVGALSSGLIFIGLIPVLLAFVFYIFDFGVLKKAALTAMIMAHLAVFVPLQYLLHAYLLHHSVLFMPLLYFAFGPFLDVLIFVGFYSWGMSWKPRVEGSF